MTVSHSDPNAVTRARLERDEAERLMDEAAERTRESSDRGTWLTYKQAQARVRTARARLAEERRVAARQGRLWRAVLAVLPDGAERESVPSLLLGTGVAIVGIAMLGLVWVGIIAFLIWLI